MSPRVLTLDCETGPLIAATFGLRNQFIGINQIIIPGRTICFAAKWLGEKDVLFYSEHHDGHEEMVKQAHRLLDEADIVITFNGDKFDLPKLYTEFDKYKMKPPSPVQSVDLYKTISKTHYFDSGKLDYALRMLELPGKVQNAGMPLWLGCVVYENDKDWSKMRTYNIADVRRTEQLYKRILPYIKNHPHMGIFNGPGMWCENCGSGRLQSRGTAKTRQGLYPRFQCQACGKWHRGKKTIQPLQEVVGIQ